MVDQHVQNSSSMRFLWLSSIAVLSLLISCNKDEGDPDPLPGTVTIQASADPIVQFEAVTYTLVNSENHPMVRQNWLRENNNVIVNSEEYTTSYDLIGDKTVKAEYAYNYGDNAADGIVEQTFTVVEAEHYDVQVDRVEITSYPDFVNYSYDPSNRISLKTYFEIAGKDGTGAPNIYYTSPENLANDEVTSFQVMDWSLGSASVSTSVYKNGDEHPNQQYTYHFNFKVYGANHQSNSPFNLLVDEKLDLNQYRSTQPGSVQVNAPGMTFKVYLTWN